MKTLKKRRDELKRLNALREFAFGLREERQQSRGHCTSLEINGRTTLIDIPQGQEARRVVVKSIPKNSIAKMNDKDFQELRGLPS